MSNERDLSVIIPSRNEEFLSVTIDNILKNKRANTEIIAVLDGCWSNPGVPQHPDVNIIYVPKSIGQRAATNLGARLAKGRFVMKLDAHCSWDEGCDLKMIQGFEEFNDDSITMVPIMRNLWMFDWKCYHCGKRTYQGPTPKVCVQCGKIGKIRKKLLIIGKHNPQSWSYCFDSSPHFQYFEEYKHRSSTKEAKKSGFTESMSLQGSCFMATRENYFKLNLCDESLGSWGNQGIEVACRTWLSGGRVIANHNTWYAHMFRTQGGDFSFPYEQKGREVSKTKKDTWNLFVQKQFAHQVLPVSWLVEKFWPVKGWTQEALNNLKKQEKCSHGH